MDPLDGREVLLTLTGLADGAVRQATAGGWRCARAVPRIDGSLYFDLRAAEQQARLAWLAPLAAGGRALGWEGTAPAQRSDLRAVLARLLQAVERNPAFALVGFHNRDRRELAFDDRVVDILLADRFSPGRTRWFDYRFQQAFQERSEAFRLTFVRGEQELVFQVCRPDHDPGSAAGPTVLDQALFKLQLLADPRSAEQRGRLPHQLERFLGFVLNRAVHAGMHLASASGTGRHSAAGPQTEQTEQRDDEPQPRDAGGPFDGAPVSTTRWGNPEQWYQFFADFEIERSSLCSVRFTDPVAEVVHGEVECKGIEPETFGPRVDFADPPWPREPVPSAEGSASLFTGLTEREVIFGASDKLERALSAACRAPGVRLVCLNNTCLPKIIGDDAASIVARLRAASPVPILSMNTDLDSPDAAFQDLVRQARDSLAERPPAGPGRGLNLIGFPPGRGRRELAAQLAEIGLQVNCCLIPEFGVADLRRYLSGRAGLVYPHGPWLALAERVLEPLGVTLTRQAAPYGLAATRRFVRAAAAALERPEAYDLWQERFFEPAAAAFAQARRQVAGQRLAFVIDRASLERLVDPARLYGFSIAPLLEEMGFGLELLVRSPTEFDALPEPLAGALAEPERHRLRTFQDAAGLDELLLAGEFAAVYSEVFFDRRISRAGKARFHLGLLELGLDGALRGLERLADLCQWPFYRRYRRYLDRAGA